MISSTVDDMSKGKTIVDAPFLIPLEELYDAIQSTSNSYLDDHHLVALDPYRLPYWLDSPPPHLDYLL